jgi:hypothetical protein
MDSPKHPLIGADVYTHNGLLATVEEAAAGCDADAGFETPLFRALAALNALGLSSGVWVRLRLKLCRKEDIPHHAVDGLLPALLVGNQILYNCFASTPKAFQCGAYMAYVLEPRCIVRAARLPPLPEPFASRVVPEAIAALVGKSHSRQGGFLVGSTWIEGSWAADAE